MGYLFNIEIQVNILDIAEQIRRLIGFIPRSNDDENYTDELRDIVIGDINWISGQDFHITSDSSGSILVFIKKKNVEEDVVYPDFDEVDLDGVHENVFRVDMFEYIHEIIRKQ